MDFNPEIVCRLSVVLIMLAGMATGLVHRKRADRVGGSVSRHEDPRWFWICMSFIGPPMLLGTLLFIVQPRWLDWSSMPLPSWARLAGLPLGLLGVASFHWMFTHLGRNVTPTSMPRPDATLVTSGPYRWIRHPMYTFGVLWYVSIALLTANWYLAASAVAAFVLLGLRSRIEERRLIEKFGDDYRQYKLVTGRFIPKWRPH
jgi:protein-S-isoprenylcysteine O-methyltransferase Ste14